MILLNDSSRKRLIAVFGNGLIGSAAIRAVQDRTPVETMEHSFSWTDPELQERQLADLESCIIDEASTADSTRPSLCILWSAGRAGFAATAEETKLEFESFRQVLGLAERRARDVPEAQVSFVLVSSAGGLFEGQQLVNEFSQPSPRRPYGFLKQAQEKLLFASSARMARRVCRPTSVYGYLRPGQRQGLIPTLIQNGIRQSKMQIYGRPTTLRDYVWIEDVGSFLAGCLLADTNPNDNETWILGSGKPSSIFEIRQIIERTVNRTVQIAYSHDPANGQNITFARNVMPPNWSIVDLTIASRRIYVDALRNGTEFNRHDN